MLIELPPYPRLECTTFCGIFTEVSSCRRNWHAKQAHDLSSRVRAGGNFELNKSNQNKSNHPQIKLDWSRCHDGGRKFLKSSWWQGILVDVVLFFFLFVGLLDQPSARRGWNDKKRVLLDKVKNEPIKFSMLYNYDLRCLIRLRKRLTFGI